MKRAFAFGFTFCLLQLAGTAVADDILFVKNQWQHRLHVWANGVYQGFVDPGQVVYMPQEGFVTEDSGIQSDGSLKMTHAYGGWPVRGTFSIEGASAPFEKDGQEVSFYSQGSETDNRGYKQWAFGTGSLSPPEGVETEHAMKMRQLREPQNILNLIAKGTTEATSGGSPISGLANSLGTSYYLKLAGAVRKPVSAPAPVPIVLDPKWNLPEPTYQPTTQEANWGPVCYQCRVPFRRLRSDGLCTTCYDQGFGDHGKH